MSERLTGKWMKDAEGAFGASGAKGDQGEEFLCEVFDAWGWEYEAHPSSFDHQIKGIDISFRELSSSNFKTADVKSNLGKYGSFIVETNDDGWLFNEKKTSDRLWHVNPATGWMAWYNRDDMKMYIESKGKRNTGLVTIAVKDKLAFIIRQHYNANVKIKKTADVTH